MTETNNETNKTSKVTIPKVTLQSANWNAEQETLRRLRRHVFIEEQQVPEHLEWEDSDSAHSTLHFIAYLGENAVGTVRAIEDTQGHYKIGRLAVLPPYRQKGIGSALLRHALEGSFKKNVFSIYLYAQTHAQTFYTQHHFTAAGEVFYEADIPHIRMTFDRHSHQAIQNIYQKRVLRHSNAHDFQRHIQHSCDISQRSIIISSQNLRSDIFDNDSIAQSLSDFVRRDRHAKVDILLHQQGLVEKRRSPILSLARRLPSKLTLRVLNRDITENTDSFIIADKQYLTFFNSEQNTEGFTHYYAAAESRSIIENFKHLWQHCATEDKNLKELW